MTACSECGHAARDHVGRLSRGPLLCIVCGCREDPTEAGSDRQHTSGPNDPVHETDEG